ncbi:MAG TPA: hypothetical protein VIT92_12990 [Burkholderiaceae bacterium]
MKRAGWLALILFGATGNALALPVNAACVVDSTVQLANRTVQVRDCVQNGGLKRETFLEICDLIANNEPEEGDAPNVTQMEWCPAKPQAVCRTVLGQPISAHHYGRDAEGLAVAREKCVRGTGNGKARGKWLDCVANPGSCAPATY